MQCNRCNREISEKQSYVYQGKVYCEDCLMDIGLSVKECDPWATYVDTRARRRLGQKGTEGLTELERRVYEFVRSKGRVTRAEVMADLGLTATELETQLLPLVHSDMLKEYSRGDTMYLIPID